MGDESERCAEHERARQDVLAQEKELTRRGDELARRRRELPWVPVENEYRFDSGEGTETLAELFDGRSQMLVYHFMFGPSDQAGCPTCSSIADSVDGIVPHLHAQETQGTFQPIRCCTPRCSRAARARRTPAVASRGLRSAGHRRAAARRDDSNQAKLVADLDAERFGRLRAAKHFAVGEGKITRLRQIHDTAPVRAAGPGIVERVPFASSAGAFP